MAEKLNRQSLKDWMEKRPGWTVKGQNLFKDFELSSFRNAIVFVNRIASLADETGKTPGVDIRDNVVRVILTTPEVAGVSQADLDFAQKVDFATSVR